MSDDAPRWASFSSAFSIVLSLASNRIAELGCDPVGEDPRHLSIVEACVALKPRLPTQRRGEFARRHIH